MMEAFCLMHLEKEAILKLELRNDLFENLLCVFLTEFLNWNLSEYVKLAKFIEAYFAN